MKKFVAATIAASALYAAFNTSLFAADMPVKAPPVVPVFNWTGSYIGIEGGWANSATRLRFEGAAAAVDPVSKDSGGLLGGTLGYNWQNGAWVTGVEADLSWIDTKSFDKGSIAGGCVPACKTEFDWFGTVRGRLGYLTTPDTLLFATGGLAVGSIHTTQPAVGGGVEQNYRDIEPGWTVGGGLEQHLQGNWTAKIEYLYVDLNHTSSHELAAGGTFARNDFMHENIVRIGLNYKFGAPLGGSY